MKHGRGFFIGALVTLVLAAALVMLAAGGQIAFAQPTIIFVDIDAQGANSGSSWHNAYTDLQDALDGAASGDQIWVAAGTYKPSHEFIQNDARSAAFQMANGVAIYGGFEPEMGFIRFDDRDWDVCVTILSGDLDGDDEPDFVNYEENSYHVFYHPAGEDLNGTAILDGFTITGGNADRWGEREHSRGGGMFNEGSSPKLSNVIFAENVAAVGGGGMYNGSQSGPALANCAFIDNRATHGGGGMFNEGGSAPVLSDCAFENNKVEGGGGGMYNIEESSPILKGECYFEGNWAEYGGGMFNRFGSSPYLEGCTFVVNRAVWRGGGMMNDESSPTLNNCDFLYNNADWGGGMQNAYSSSPALTNCIFRENWAVYGGAMSNDFHSAPTVTNCTLWGSRADYYGGGMYNTGESWPTVTNSILWANGESEIYNQNSLATVTYSDIQGGYLGTGNIDQNPLFLDPGIGDVHLGSGSPCIDAGTNSAPSLPDYDFEGDLRKLDGNGDGWAVADMGVDEYALHLPVPQPVPISITPAIPSNVIKLSSPRPVPVAILSTEEFHVFQVAADTVMFAGAPHAGFAYADVDGDDVLDLVLDFYPEQMDELTPDSKEATLTGETLEGGLIEGTDSVKVRE